ncbi:hypothetical protein [Micromonospora sp. KC213]|uniref:hypothetical protein n=1 Tax=Micromonospora sp. KC213 TaxID=2530378 RepID=UPI001053C4DF|nr:hypothetical protein [Micromonospora sp. KC213]TDC42079.1 hypothetical protein E1166_08960 [Micromonospora sp. KC213]
MRAKFRPGILRIDQIDTSDEVADVVRLVTAAGFLSIHISRDVATHVFEVDVDIPGGWPADLLPPLMAVCAAFGGPSPQEMLEQWQAEAATFQDAKAKLGQS